MPVSWTLRTIAPILPVRDVRQALARYAKLGFRPRIYAEPGSTGPLIYGFLHRGELQLHLALTTDLDPHWNMTAVYFYVDNPDAIFAEWSAAGVDGCLEPPEDREWGMREMTYSDPDGNLLRIGRTLDAD
jgi:catechol 2,3-dioxygenase-like lactoylglutathione lyase family enzyme